MSPSLSRKVFYATAALMMTWSTIRAGPADELIKKGDDCDLKLQAAKALDFYLAAEKLEPKSASLLLRIARQYRHLMVDATTREEKLGLGGIGLDYALRASALGPNDSDPRSSDAGARPSRNCLEEAPAERISSRRPTPGRAYPS
jgi:hypothetical protein